MLGASLVVYTAGQMRTSAKIRISLLLLVLTVLLPALSLGLMSSAQQASVQRAKPSKAPPAAAPRSRPSAGVLTIYSIDVEGGQATLLVGPSKASLLVDTGWPGNNGRDVERIQAAMKDAGITQIDHVLITHFHVDHVGGVPNLVQRVKVGEFLDHGEDRELSSDTKRDYAAYLKAIQGTPRRIVKPGDTINLPGLSAIVITADGKNIKSVPGVTSRPNPYCANEPTAEADPTENARSAGVLVTFGIFRFLDLGDLTKQKEIELVCPDSPLPKIDVYLVNHHGFNLSNTKAFVDSIHPRVAIMNNGAHKAGSPEAWQTVHDSPGLEDLYMVHTAEGSDAAHNSPEELIANPKGNGEGAYFEIVAHPDGTFSVFNSRTGATKEYTSKKRISPASQKTEK